MLIKVCGLTRQDDLDRLQKLSVEFCGFIFHPGSKRYITPESAARLETGVMMRTGVFVNQHGKELTNIMRGARLHYAQFHGSQSLSDASLVGRDKIIRVLWPNRYAKLSDLLNEAEKWAGYCSFYLLDAGKHGGGSGATLEWHELECLELPHPWLLAGGLSAANITHALDMCSPQGIDLNSGVELKPGVKDCKQIEQTIKLVRQERNL